LFNLCKLEKYKKLIFIFLGYHCTFFIYEVDLKNQLISTTLGLGLEQGLAPVREPDTLSGAAQE